MNDKSASWEQLSDFERRSCATKRRYSREPPLPNMTFKAYACGFCGGWHLTSRYKRTRTANRNADLRYRRLVEQALSFKGGKK